MEVKNKDMKDKTVEFKGFHYEHCLKIKLQFALWFCTIRKTGPS
jgi:hypothetical protein